MVMTDEGAFQGRASIYMTKVLGENELCNELVAGTG